MAKTDLKKKKKRSQAETKEMKQHETHREEFKCPLLI